MHTQWQEPWQERRLAPPMRDNDVRSPWERDYARIIHSAAFRRLQSKTQVLDLGQSDFYRTRLTHSMEVAQVSHGLIKFLQQQYAAEPIAEALPDGRLLAAICLAHDIGHPPHGHGGEVALNYCMRDFGGFEGNGQTLRILSLLEQYTKAHGLNPTRRLMLGILKYPAPYSRLVNPLAYGAHNAQPAWLFKRNEQFPPKCYHDSEQSVVDWMLEPLGSDKELFCALRPISEAEKAKPAHRKTLHASLDATIMNLADDISYSLHDLEDAVAMGMLTREMWEEYMLGKEDIFTPCGFTSTEVANDLFSSEEYLRKGRIGALVHHMVTNASIMETGLSKTCPLIAYKACLKEDAARLQSFMGELVFDLVISSPNVQLQEFRGRKTVVELFHIFASDPLRLLPLEVQKLFKIQDDEQGRMRVVCDYIASMTDATAARLHEKIFAPGKGSVFDKM